MSAADRERALVPYSPSLGARPARRRVAPQRRSRGRAPPSARPTRDLAVALRRRPLRHARRAARESDRLNEDFNYVALLGSIVVLVVASWGTQWMIKRREAQPRGGSERDLRGTVSTIVTQRRGARPSVLYEARGRLDELKAEIDRVEAWSSIDRARAATPRAMLALFLVLRARRDTSHLLRQRPQMRGDGMVATVTKESVVDILRRAGRPRAVSVVEGLADGRRAAADGGFVRGSVAAAASDASCSSCGWPTSRGRARASRRGCGTRCTQPAADLVRPRTRPSPPIR